MATLTPTVEQIATSRQYLHAAKRIADDHQVQTRIGDGALEVRLDGCEQPRLSITVGSKPVRRRSAGDCSRSRRCEPVDRSWSTVDVATLIATKSACGGSRPETFEPPSADPTSAQRAALAFCAA